MFPWSERANVNSRLNVNWLARLNPEDRFGVAFNDHINRNWNAGIAQTMRLPAILSDEEFADTIHNCSTTITACNSNFDCSKRCIARDDGHYICRQQQAARQQPHDDANESVATGVCMFEKFNIPTACNYAHGGVLAATYNSSLREIMYTCLCTQPEVWTGVDCENENPYYCKGGNIIPGKSSIEWDCKCNDVDKSVLLRINKEPYQYESRNAFICVSSDMAKLLTSLEPEKYFSNEK